MDDPPHPLLRDLLPAFANQVKAELLEGQRPDLAEQVDSLTIWEKCGCGDDFCSSFYTGGPRPVRRYSDEGEHHTVPLLVDHRMVNLDTVSGAIRHVEVLDRPDVHAVVEELPAARSGRGNP